MAVIGSATLNIVPKVQGGLANAINGEVRKANLAASGKAAGSSFMGGLTSGAAFGLWSNVASRAIDAVTGSLGSAASRVDTLNNYPHVMEQLGVKGDVAKASIQTMSDALSNVPTRLDDMASATQGIFAASLDYFDDYNKGLQVSTNAGLALNSMLLSGGKSTAVANAAMEQFQQILAKGKPELQDWRSLINAAPTSMHALAEEMLGAGHSAMDLYYALGGGKEADAPLDVAWKSIGVDEFLLKLANMKDKFASTAEEAQGGIGTAFANMQNAVTKGVANVLQAFGQERIASAIGDVKGAINSIFGTDDTQGLRAFAVEVAPMVSAAWDGMVAKVSGFAERVAPSVGQIGQTLIGVAQDVGPSVSTMLDTLLDSAADLAPTVADLTGSVAGAVGDTVKGIAGVVTEVAPVISSIAQSVLPVVGDIVEDVGPALPVILTAKAALGGMGSLAGGLTAAGKGVSTLAGAFGKVSGVAGAVAEVVPMIHSVSDIGPALSLAAESGGGFLAALNPMGIAAGAAAVGVGVLGVGLYEAWHQEREFNKTYETARSVLSDMRSNTEGLGAALTVGSDSVRDFGTASATAAGDMDGFLSSLQEHNRRNAETRQSAEESVYMLGQYKAVVDECAGAGEVSAEKQAQLEWALRGIQEATGKTFTAEQVLTGEYENQEGAVESTKDAIDRLIEAKQREAKVNALQDMYTDAIKEQMKAEKAHQEISEKYHAAHDNWVKGVAEGYEKQGMSAKEAAEAAEEAFRNGQHGHLAQEYEMSAEALEGLAEETQTYANMLGELTEAENAHWGEREGIIMTTEKMKAACEEMGISAKDLAQGLQDAGVSTEQFAAIGGDQFAMMAEMAGGDMSTLIGLIQSYNAEEFQDKYGYLHVDGYGNIVDAEGAIYEWNGTEMVPKYADVDASGAVAGAAEAKNAVAEAQGPPAPIQLTATADTTQVDRMKSSIESAPKNTNVTLNGIVNRGAVDGLLGTLQRANGSRYSVYFDTYNTTHNKTINETVNKGGKDRSATGAHIEPRHASGFLAAGPTRTNYGLVGEDGIEAVYNNDDGSSDVYPLNNPRYLGYADPLAERIADAIASKGALGGGGVSVYIDGARVNDDPAIQAAFLNFFSILQRKGAMNRG